MLSMRIIVLGAGIVGIMTSYYLKKMGYEVIVIDGAKESATEASFANGGQLSYAHSEPWAHPDILSKIPKWLLQKESPLLYPFSFDIARIKWSLHFLSNCTLKKNRSASQKIMQLALHSKKCLHEILEEHNIQFSHRKNGCLHVFTKHEGMKSAIVSAKYKEQLGCDYQISSVAECLELNPSLNNNIIGGIFYPDDESGNINHFCKEMERICKNMGVEFIYNSHVSEIKHDGDKITGLVADGQIHTADNYIVALGSHSPKLLNKIGIKTNIYPVKGYSISIDVSDFNQSLLPTTAITYAEKKVVASRLGNILRIAGTAEFSGYNNHIRPERIVMLKNIAAEIFPEIMRQPNLNITEWSCLRSATPNNLPVIGASKYQNLYLNTGHGTLGWTLGCGTANIVSYIVKYGKLPTGIDI
jgi:D-amino-acid dehydrogenase